VKREIIVNVTHNEIRIAIIDNNILIDLFVERMNSTNILNNIYKGKVKKIIPALGSAFVDIGNKQTAYLGIEDTNIHVGQEVLVQVTKEAIGSKCPKITKNIIIPGRFLIYIPLDIGLNISKKIKGHNRVSLLNSIINLQKKTSIQGKLIIRTSSQQASLQEIAYELQYLFNIWCTVLHKFKHIPSPGMLYKDFNAIIKVVRDYYSNNISIIHIDSKDKEIFTDTIKYLQSVKSQLYNKVIFYKNKNIPIFKVYNVAKDINKLFANKVILKSGGYILIKELEYISVIDVNSGKFTSKLIQEETALHTNIEATKEIARQIRLRNIGGIIIIDFIDMKQLMNRAIVFNKLRNYTKSDRAKIKIWPITHLGLIEMIRERKRKSLLSVVYSMLCPHCNGQGTIVSF
jgi:ribonuclease G